MDLFHKYQHALFSAFDSREILLNPVHVQKNISDTKCGKSFMLVFMKKVNKSSKSCSCRCLVVFILIKSSKHNFFSEICRLQSHVDKLCSFIVRLETMEYEAELKHQNEMKRLKADLEGKYVYIYIYIYLHFRYTAENSTSYHSIVG